ncbi:uncharacterized protein LOC132613126 [Lycium barbarum]|uniref:uncharacterized protein LOC132613126 n=1 Tax=Lycium barbarum TaxID=112863 RepID=UPI00293F3AB9|nr:uncharacterized protein LOC132613126 [Lycium barbarum]
MIKENQDTQQTLAQLATNISLLTKKFEENQTKKVNVCEDASGMPKGMYHVQEGPYQEGPPMQVEDANCVNNSQGGYQRQNFQGGYQNQNQWRPQQGQGIVGSHTMAIHNLELQMHDISREQHLPKKRGLPSDTILNPKNGGSGVDHVFAISTRGGKLLQSAKKKVVDLEPINEKEEVQSDASIIDDELPSKEKTADILESSKVADDKSKQIVKGALCPLTQLFKSKPPFPQRLIKKKDDTKFEKFYDQLKQLSLNFPFLDVVKEMTGFAKHLKDLLTKKKTVQHETVSLTHTVSSILSTTTVQKKGDAGAFTISCSIGYHGFARALCDNGASINFMPFSIYKKSGLGMPRPTTMRLQMVDRSIKRQVGMVDDVLVWVGKFMLSTNFVILDCAIDRDIPIILRRPFLAMGRSLMDSEKNEIKFRDNDEEVTFEAIVEFKMEDESLGEALATILVNFDAEDMKGYVETKLNLDLENRTTPPAKPSIVEPPKLEFKQLSSYLKYEFLGPNNTLPVIISALLTEDHIERLVEILREYRRAIGLTIADIRRILSEICEHKI